MKRNKITGITRVRRALLLTLAMLLSTTVWASYTDVPESSAAHEAIEWATQAGVALGTGGGSFEPDAPCTKAAFLTFAWRLYGAPDMGEDTAWWSDAAAWAVRTELLEAGGGMEQPLDGGELAALMEKLGAPVSGGEAAVTRGEAIRALYDAKVAAHRIAYRVADRAEGQKLRLGNTNYFENLTQNDLDYRVGARGATLAQFQAIAAEEVRGFSDTEKSLMAQSIARIERRVAALDITLPFHGEIVFVKTTMREEGDAGAYTHKNEIYLGESLFAYAADPEWYDDFDAIMLHEMFHCLSRNDASFRAAMYNLIGFTVADEVPFTKDVRDHILSNPDVERYDNYASFTVDGKPTDCIIVPYVEDYQEGFESFFDHLTVSLVPVDEPNRFIPASEVPDFNDRIGENTDYVIAAEECMADNFSYAIVYDTSRYEWPTPEILDGVLKALR